jgi:hypothetical protein
VVFGTDTTASIHHAPVPFGYGGTSIPHRGPTHPTVGAAVRDFNDQNTLVIFPAYALISHEPRDDHRSPLLRSRDTLPKAKRALNASAKIVEELVRNGEDADARRRKRVVAKHRYESVNTPVPELLYFA